MDTDEELKVIRVSPPALHVRDLQKMEMFFRSVFACRVVARERLDQDDMVVVELQMPGEGVTVKLIAATGEGARAEVVPDQPVTIRVEDIAAAVEILRAHGVEFEELPWTRRSGAPVRFARFLGPDDISFELLEGAS